MPVAQPSDISGPKPRRLTTMSSTVTTPKPLKTVEVVVKQHLLPPGFLCFAPGSPFHLQSSWTARGFFIIQDLTFQCCACAVKFRKPRRRCHPHSREMVAEPDPEASDQTYVVKAILRRTFHSLKSSASPSLEPISYW